MEVILLERIRNLGVLGDTVNVKSGYARNFLVPQGKAVYANKQNIAKFEQKRAELEALAAEKHKEALSRQEALNALPAITIAAKVGEEGKLFGSITVRDILDALTRMGVKVEKHEIQLSEASIRSIGEYTITINLESDLVANIKLNVIAE